MKSKYTFSDFEAENKQAILELMEESWGPSAKDLLNKIWEWKYLQNPMHAENQAAGYIMKHDDKVIGAMGTLATNIRMNGKDYPAVFGTDLIISKQHRGAGVRFLRTAFDINKTIQIGTPQDRAYELEKKMGCTDVSRYQERIAITNLKSYLINVRGVNTVIASPLSLIHQSLCKTYLTALGLFSASNRNNDVRITENTQFDERFDHLWHRVADTYASISCRNQKALDWRYIKSPNRKNYTILTADNKKGELKGFLIYSKYHKDGMNCCNLVDFLVENGDASTLHSLVKKAMRDIRKNKTALVRANISEGHLWIEKTLNQHGFLIKREGLNITNGSGGVANKEFQTAQPLYFTLADSDIEMSDYFDLD